MLTRFGADTGKRRIAAVFLAIATAFLLLYVRDLAEKSLWVDELSSFDFATRDLPGVIRASAGDVHPPAYFVVLYFWLNAFGHSDFALRLPSAVFSAIGLILLYVLGKKLSGNREAIIAVCFAIVSPFYLLFSHMARYYTMALTVSLFSTLLLVVALERKNWRYWLAYGIGCALVLYTDYPAAAIIAAHGIFLIGRELVRYLRRSDLIPNNIDRSGFHDLSELDPGYGIVGAAGSGRPRGGRVLTQPSGWVPRRSLPHGGDNSSCHLKYGLTCPHGGRREAFGGLGSQQTVSGWLLGAAVGFALYAPWLGTAIGRAAKGSWLVADYAGGPMGVALKLGTSVYSFSVGETIFPWNPLALAGMAAVLATLFIGLSARRGDEGQGMIFSAVLLTVSLASTIMITTLLMPMVTFLNVASRTMFAFPYFALLVAAGFVRLGRWAWVVVALVLVSNVVGYVDYVSGSGFLNPIYTVPSKQIAADVESAIKPGDVVISTVDSVFERYYDADVAAKSPHFLFSSWDEAKPFIERNGAQRVWVITLGLDANRWAYPAEAVGWLRSNYAFSMTKGYAEQDPTYLWVKEKLLKREPYRYKAMVGLYEKR